MENKGIFLTIFGSPLCSFLFSLVLTIKMHPRSPRQSPARNSHDRAIPRPKEKTLESLLKAIVDSAPKVYSLRHMLSLNFTKSAGGCLQLSAIQLILATGATSENAAKCVGPLNEALIEFNISTALRICHFLAQVGTETGLFQSYVENMKYLAAERIKKMLNSKDGTRFPTVDSARQYVCNPVGLANYAYARTDLGNVQQGDGFRFIGRGAIHLTGRDNYERASRELKVGTLLVTNPKLVETPKYAFRVAGWFWNNHKLNKWADADDVRKITSVVNVGLAGYPERVALLQRAKMALMPNLMPDVVAWPEELVS